MKENGRKALGPCHQEHVNVLNHLTDTLKDELKRGLTLLDNCVNQLAQAKWILINVERTMEDFYTDCPACDGPPKGSRATTPPSAITAQSTSNAVGKKSSKAKKASVLPMVSGHTVQRPKINIARVDARTSKKSKRTESVSGGSGRGRSRAASTSAQDSHNIIDDPSEVASSSRKKLKPGPRSRTRIIATGGIPSSSFVAGNDVSVNLEDIGYLLEGRESFKGAELTAFTGEPISEPTKSSSSKVLENVDKKRKFDTSDDEGDSTSIKKKTDDQSVKLKPLSLLKSSTAPGIAPVKTEMMKSLIQQTFLKFTKSKPSLQKDVSGSIPSTSRKSDDTTSIGSDKRRKLSEDSESHLRVKSVEKRTAKEDESSNDSDDENLATLKDKKGKGTASTTMRRSKKKNHSTDDDDSASKTPERQSKSPERKVVANKVNTVKRTGGKPGPKSAKLREQEREKQREKNDERENNVNSVSKKKSSAISSAVVFTDSEDSDNSVLRSTIKNIPLDLQDAIRSPSPQNSKDIFGKLLSTYNHSAQQNGFFEKLKSRAKQIKPKIFELDADLQEKLSSVGRELVPYTGSVEATNSSFSIGKYYVVGKGSDEKLVFFDSSHELQELDLASDDIEELLED